MTKMLGQIFKEAYDTKAVWAECEAAGIAVVAGEEPTGINPDYDELLDKISEAMRQAASGVPAASRRVWCKYVYAAIRPLFDALRQRAEASEAELAELREAVDAAGTRLLRFYSGMYRVHAVMSGQIGQEAATPTDAILAAHREAKGNGG